MSSPIRGITTCGVPAATPGLASASPSATVAMRVLTRVRKYTRSELLGDTLDLDLLLGLDLARALLGLRLDHDPLHDRLDDGHGGRRLRRQGQRRRDAVARAVLDHPG